MNLLLLAAAVIAGWLLRRSIATRIERASLFSLPPGPDGIIAGAQSIERRGGAGRAVLILHGFGDTPQTVSYLAEHLHGLGFTVRAPLLAGHGRTLREFGVSTADAWIDAAARELSALRLEYEAIGVVGVSMGGALSVILAAEASRRGSATAKVAAHVRDAEGVLDRSEPADRVPRPDALVLIAPYLSMRTPARRLAAMHWAVSPFVRYLVSREEASIRDEAERKSNRGFGTVTPGLLNELQRLVSRARRVLGDVTVPTLVIQSRDDNRIEPGAATQAFEQLGAPEKRFEWTEGGGHVITVDRGRERVFALTGEWLLARVGVNAPPTPAS
jgi:carboxylesterase